MSKGSICSGSSAAGIAVGDACGLELGVAGADVGLGVALGLAPGRAVETLVCADDVVLAAGSVVGLLDEDCMPLLTRFGVGEGLAFC
ncbi:MAG: hypothetical protein WBW04_13640 [Nitrolancea sp.]